MIEKWTMMARRLIANIAVVKCLYVPLVISLFGHHGLGATPNAADVLNKSGFTGGLIVCIGCDEPEFLAELGHKGSCLVHALDTNPAKIASTRTVLREKGLYGKISVEAFSGKHLPYTDNLVNLLVAGSECQGPSAQTLSQTGSVAADLISHTMEI